MRHWTRECADSVEIVPRMTHRNTNEAVSVVSSSNTPDPSSSHSGPELVLTPVDIVPPLAGRTPISPPHNRSGSSPRPGNGSNQLSPLPIHAPTKPQPPIHIPLSDVLVVESIHSKQQKQHRCHKMRITTQSLGFFVFDDLNLNSRDVLLTFLKAHIWKSRLIEVSDSHKEQPDDISIPSVTSASSSCSPMDVDKFMAEKIRKSSERESLSEKVGRRTSRLVIILSEFCSSVSDSACCKARSSASTEDELRDLPTRTPGSATSRKSIKLAKGNLEEEESTVSSTMGGKKKKRKDIVESGLSALSSPRSNGNKDETNTKKEETQREPARNSPRDYRLPSGLSVEEEPASEEQDS